MGVINFLKVGVTNFLKVGVTNFLKVGVTNFLKVGVMNFLKVGVTSFLKVLKVVVMKILKVVVTNLRHFCCLLSVECKDLLWSCRQVKSKRYLRWDTNGGRSSMVRVSEFKSKDPRFDPLVGQGGEEFFCPPEATLLQICLCLTPLHVYGMHPNLCTR